MPLIAGSILLLGYDVSLIREMGRSLLTGLRGPCILAVQPANAKNFI